jgi:HTH-type transcriptional regulator/antitoxin HigA
MKAKLIKTEQEYEEALARVDDLMCAQPGTPRFDELELWTHLVEVYESEHFVIEPPDPVSAIKFRLDQMGLAPKDLVPLLGCKSRVSEVLNRKRTLSLAMIRSLYRGLGIPVQSLFGEYAPQAASCVAEKGAEYGVARRRATK